MNEWNFNEFLALPDTTMLAKDSEENYIARIHINVSKIFCLFCYIIDSPITKFIYRRQYVHKHSPWLWFLILRFYFSENSLNLVTDI